MLPIQSQNATEARGQTFIASMSLTISGFDVLTRPTLRPGDPGAGPYDGFKPFTSTLKKGYRRSPEHAAFQADTILEKDFAVIMRDGVKLYCDIFRPDDTQKVPAIILWSPYGKGGNGVYLIP
jgi:hypothetical protein